MSSQPDWVHRGVICLYRDQKTPIKIESEPFDYSGQLCVAARTQSKRRKDQQQGMYAVSALHPIPETQEESK